jgi:hypothetical protein
MWNKQVGLSSIDRMIWLHANQDWTSLHHVNPQFYLSLRDPQFYLSLSS